MLLARPVDSTGEPRTMQNMGLNEVCTPETSAEAFTAPSPPQDISLRITAPFKDTYEWTLRLLTYALIQDAAPNT